MGMALKTSAYTVALSKSESWRKFWVQRECRVSAKRRRRRWLNSNALGNLLKKNTHHTND